MKVLWFLKGILAVILSFFLSLLPGAFPRVPHEKKLDLVWADEFDGNELDETKWKICGESGTSVRRGSYWNLDMATVEDGNLHIRTQYYPKGYKGNEKPGWYTCGIDTSGLFEQKYGYFEVRCILPKGVGLWSAFWMQSNGMFKEDAGGTNGAEIDVMEAPFFKDKFKKKVTSNIHIDGYGEAHKSKKVCNAYVLFRNPYEEFNTYGVEWNEKQYTFYVNGIKTAKSDFGGASQVPEYLLLSVEVGGENAVPADSWAGKALENDSEVTDFIVDYVRVYQYKQ